MVQKQLLITCGLVIKLVTLAPWAPPRPCRSHSKAVRYPNFSRGHVKIGVLACSPVLVCSRHLRLGCCNCRTLAICGSSVLSAALYVKCFDNRVRWRHEDCMPRDRGPRQPGCIQSRCFESSSRPHAPPVWANVAHPARTCVQPSVRLQEVVRTGTPGIVLYLSHERKTPQKGSVIHQNHTATNRPHVMVPFSIVITPRTSTPKYRR
jgi:hypothetical protein